MRWKRLILYILMILSIYLFIKAVKENLLNSKISSCKISNEVRENIHKLSLQVHQILTNLDITHILCYESLWGLLHYEQSLPWKHEIEFCAVNERALYLDEANLLRSFRKHGLDLDYDWVEGIYKVFNSSHALGNVKIILFELDPVLKMMRRIGWKRRVLPPDCGTNTILHCFPPRLIQTPLPSKKFNGAFFPVPHEEIEIQKYLYPSDWWKELKPHDC